MSLFDLLETCRIRLNLPGREAEFYTFLQKQLDEDVISMSVAAAICVKANCKSLKPQFIMVDFSER